MSMTKTRIVPLIVCCLLLNGPLFSQAKINVNQTANTIFQAINAGDDLPELKITADFAYLLANKKTDHYVPAQLEVDNETGSAVHGIELQVRGKYRRRVCDFPPLRIKFGKKYLSSLGYEKHNKLKLVTHCIDAKLSGNENVVKEYLAYKLYELLNPNSYQVALVRLTYHDSGAAFGKVKRLGILIEDTDEMADRVGGEECECFSQPLESFAAKDEATMALFQYMIGNEDWEVASLRNVKLVKRPDDVLVPVPFDFDFAGLVNAPYAIPNPDLGLKSITERHFMGSGRNSAVWTKVVSRFRENREDLLALIREQKGLGSDEKSRILAYIEAFYDELPRLAFLPEEIDLYHVEKR